MVWYTVDQVIFACLNFREFLILGPFTKFKIREFSFFFSSSIIIIIFARFLNSRICPLKSRNSRKLKPREYYQIYRRWPIIIPTLGESFVVVRVPLEERSVDTDTFARVAYIVLNARTIHPLKIHSGHEVRSLHCLP